MEGHEIYLGREDQARAVYGLGRETISSVLDLTLRGQQDLKVEVW